jgi:glyoxylase-like metal-dependent hydrolase (beta-lactamase superfamily II)
MDEKAWDEPGVEQVLEGVFRIPLPLPNDGLRAVNVYVIADGDGLVLIDSGWALTESLEQLERGLAEIEHKLTDVSQFLVTHAHRDHYTQALTVRRMFGTSVRIGAGERATLELLVGPSHVIFETVIGRMEAAGAHVIVDQLLAEREKAQERPARTVWELPDGWLTPGPIHLKSRTLEAIETPGHTTGHLVFHDPAAVALFAGDHVLPRITPSIGLEAGGSDLPLQNYLDSLRMVRSMPDAKLLPAHGPVTASVHARVDELLAHHEQRLTDSANALDQGASTAYEVAQILLWTRRNTPFKDLTHHNAMLAVSETAVHLDVCVARGWLTMSDDSDGITHYARA